MAAIERDDEGFVVPVGMLAEAFDLRDDQIRTSMLDDMITSKSEIGVDADEGRWRLTFYYRNRACRFIVDDSGLVLHRIRFSTRARTTEWLRTRHASCR